MGVAHRVTTQVTQAGTAPFLSCILHTPCAGFLKTGTWYRVPGPGYLAPGTRDRINAEGRTPRTELNAHTGFAYPVGAFFEA